jgi:UDP-N-acetyl-D-galactosamine dehydrogenase
MKNNKIAIIGQGYVGLPLAVEFGKKYHTIGFDINQSRIEELSSGRDSTLECSSEELSESTHLSYTSELSEIADCNIYIVTVPTPITEDNVPDLTPLKNASEALGSIIKKEDVIIY